MNFVLGHMLLTKGNRAAKVVIIDIVPFNEIVIITHHTDFANHLNRRAKLLLKLAKYCNVGVFVWFNATARGFNTYRPAKIVIAVTPLYSHSSSRRFIAIFSNSFFIMYLYQSLCTISFYYLNITRFKQIEQVLPNFL